MIRNTFIDVDRNLFVIKDTQLLHIENFISPQEYHQIPSIRAILEMCFPVSDLILQVYVSIGTTFYPQNDEVDGDQLICQADQAIYVAKQSGKKRHHFFDTKQDAELG